MPNKDKIFNKISFSLPLWGISHNTLPGTSGQAKFNELLKRLTHYKTRDHECHFIFDNAWNAFFSTPAICIR